MTNRLRVWVASTMLTLALLASVLPPASRAQAVQVPNAEQCFQATTGINGMLGVLGTLTGGSGGTAGLYTNISLTTSGAGSGATANITVSGGAVTQVAILSPGINYAVGDSISAASGSIGNVSGFTTYVSSISINSSLAGGTVGMYAPGTLTFSQTWQNASQTALNTNPIRLDANGCALIYGVGIYRQILYDSLGNEVWDQLTSVAPVNPYWAGNASGTANTLTVADASFGAVSGQQIQLVAAFANTGPATLDVTTGSLGNLPILINTSSGTAPLVGGELSPNSVAVFVYSASLNSWILTNPQGATVSAALAPVVEASSTSAAYVALGGAVPTPSGRLTLVSGVPVLVGATVGASSVIYTPYSGQQIPVWNGSAWALTTFGELSESLGDTTYAPAAAAPNSLYDQFVCRVGGSLVLSRGPAWGSASARSLAIGRVQGYFANSSSITNGCAAGYGFYVGTVATDTAAATVTFNPYPAPASTGPTGGAWIGLWNQYNRVTVVAAEADTNCPWAWTTAAWREADGSPNNRITFVAGNAEDSISAQYGNSGTTTTTGSYFIGIGLNVGGPASGSVGVFADTNVQGSAISGYRGPPALGQSFLQAIEYGNTGVTYCVAINAAMQMSSETRY